VEEFLDGPEFSIVTFSCNGRHIVFGVTQKVNYGESMANPYLETGHVVPAEISESMLNEIEEYIVGLLNALGLRDGPAHSEIRITSNGPRLIETHPRIGGDYITELVRLTSGHDLTQMSALWPLGLCEPPAGPVKWSGAAAVKYFGADAGMVLAINGLDAVRGDPNVRHVKFRPDIGQTVHVPLSETMKSSERIGSVLCTGITPREAISCCERAVSMISISVASKKRQEWRL